MPRAAAVEETVNRTLARAATVHLRRAADGQLAIGGLHGARRLARGGVPRVKNNTRSVLSNTVRSVRGGSARWPRMSV